MAKDTEKLTGTTTFDVGNKSAGNYHSTGEDGKEKYYQGGALISTFPDDFTALQVSEGNKVNTSDVFRNANTDINKVSQLSVAGYENIGKNLLKLEVGASFTKVTNLIDLGDGYGLAGVSGTSANDAKVARTTDNWKTINLIDLGAAYEECESLCNVGNGVVLAGVGLSTGDGDILRSTDYGATWGAPIDIDANAEQVHAMRNVGNNTIVAVVEVSGQTAFKFFKSEDGGLTWNAGVDIPDDGRVQHNDSICYAGNGIVFIGLRSAKGIAKVTLGTPDVIEILTLPVSGKSVTSITNLGNGILQGAEEFISRDNGVTWEVSPLQPYSDTFAGAVSLGNGKALFGTKTAVDNLYITDDYAETLTEIELNISTLGIESLLWSNGILLFTSSGSAGQADIYRCDCSFL